MYEADTGVLTDCPSTKLAEKRKINMADIFLKSNYY
jgi:hypothetical protein